jgi:hypothetical protein
MMSTGAEVSNIVRVINLFFAPAIWFEAYSCISNIIAIVYKKDLPEVDAYKMIF